MTLYLMRHAEAEVLSASDHARCLTEKGETQAERAGKFCRKHGIAPEIILTSPVLRALQTAKIVAKSLEGAELVETPWAACGMNVATAVAELQGYVSCRSIMLVGHQPDLGALAASLLGCTNVGALHVRKSLLCGIDMSHGFRHGVLEFFVPVKLMG